MKSFRFAFSGIMRTIHEERHMRIHLCCAFYALAEGYVSGISRMEWIAVLLCIGLVTGMECLNTALEAACDEITQKLSPGIRRAKDAAAGAVLLAAVAAAAVGVVIFCRAERLACAVQFVTNNPVTAILLVLALPAWPYYIFWG